MYLVDDSGTPYVALFSGISVGRKLRPSERKRCLYLMRDMGHGRDAAI